MSGLKIFIPRIYWMKFQFSNSSVNINDILNEKKRIEVHYYCWIIYFVKYFLRNLKIDDFDLKKKDYSFICNSWIIRKFLVILLIKI